MPKTAAKRLYIMNKKIKLEKADWANAEEILSMQQSAFAPLLKKYKDYGTVLVSKENKDERMLVTP